MLALGWFIFYFPLLFLNLSIFRFKERRHFWVLSLKIKWYDSNGYRTFLILDPSWITKGMHATCYVPSWFLNISQWDVSVKPHKILKVPMRRFWSWPIHPDTWRPVEQEWGSERVPQNGITYVIILQELFDIYYLNLSNSQVAQLLDLFPILITIN